MHPSAILHELLVDVKCITTIPLGPPVLDEETFQRLLAAAHTLQECNDRLGKEPIIGDVGLSQRENAKLAVAQLAAQSGDVAFPDPPQEQGIPVAQASVQPFAPQSHLLIPPETARQFSMLASQLEALIQQEVRSDSECPRLPVSVAEEIPAEEQQGPADQAGVPGKAAFEQPQSESTQLIPLVQRAVPRGTSNSPHRI